MQSAGATSSTSSPARASASGEGVHDAAGILSEDIGRALAERLGPDVVVFDTSTAGLDGLELAAQLARAQGRFPVVVVVAGHAPQPATVTEPAFEEVSVDAFGSPEPSLGRSEPYETGIWVTGRRGAMRISLSSVACFTADRDYVRVRADGGEHLIRLPMRNLLQRLDPAQFLRVHRSAIVNRKRVEGIERCAGGMLKIVLDTGLGVPVARRYLKAVKAALITPPSRPALSKDDETAAGLIWA